MYTLNHNRFYSFDYLDPGNFFHFQRRGVETQLQNFDRRLHQIAGLRVFEENVHRQRILQRESRFGA